jgi:LacI family repressor for deo operon, udp, cdd, tsx, nupC, and nupG
MMALRAAGVEPVAGYDLAGLFTAAGGRTAGEALLSLPSPPTAVVAASDEMAMGVLAAARCRGVQVPQELSVVGVDGHELGEMQGLTTVVQPVREQGALAARMVLEALRGEPRRRHEHVVVPVHLEVRESTGPAPE